MSPRANSMNEPRLATIVQLILFNCNQLNKDISTTFGIKGHNNEMIEVAHRHNIGNNKVQIDILNPLVLLLPNHIHVEALDNTAQGINCVGDIKMLYNLQNNPNVAYIQII
jgi:hypothetical protein